MTRGGRRSAKVHSSKKRGQSKGRTLDEDSAGAAWRGLPVRAVRNPIRPEGGQAIERWLRTVKRQAALTRRDDAGAGPAGPLP